MVSSPPLAVQLYTMRSMPEPFDLVLADIAAIGYRAVETVADQGLEADELRRMLDRHALQVVSTHVKLSNLEEDPAQIIAFNQAIGNATLTIASLPMALRPNDAAGWRAVGKRLNELGKRCRDHGMRLLYHNHEYEMAACDQRLAIEWLLDGAQPENLGFEPDLAWIVAGDADPQALLTQFAGRCPCVHLKDLAHPERSDNEKGVADVGYGTLDWDSLLAVARRSGAEWFIVEHDLPNDPVESIRRSFDFLQNLWLQNKWEN